MWCPVSEPSPDAALRDREPTKLERLKVALCEVITLAAQSDERGRSSATVVIAREPASGKVLRRANPRPAKMAFQVSGVHSKKVRKPLTGNNHSATTHNHQELKHLQVWPSHLLARPNGPAELPHEQAREPPDRDSLCCECNNCNPVLIVVRGVGLDSHCIRYAFCKSKCQGE